MDETTADPIAELRRDARRIFLAALHAVEPGPLVHQAILNAPELQRASRVHVLAVGKAAHAMAAAAVETLGARVGNSILVAPENNEQIQPPASTMHVFRSGHPLPDANSERAADAARAMIRETSGADAIVALVSGGASSLLVKPADGISLHDYGTLTHELMRKGASIQELNCVRRHIDMVKGGNLALIANAPVVCLLISDVVRDDISVIGSGPFAVDASTFEDASNVLKRYDCTTPASITTHLRKGMNGEIPETLKSSDHLDATIRIQIIADNAIALDAAAHYAKRLDYDVVRIHDAVVGAAADAGRRAASVSAAEHQRRTCILSGGETVVVVSGDGRGGRNQELALAAAMEIDGQSAIVILSAGTDGIDGATDAAGAIVDGGTCERIRACGIDPHAALANNDSYSALAAAGDLLHTGPTGTNVMDVHIVLCTGDDSRHH